MRSTISVEDTAETTQQVPLIFHGPLTTWQLSMSAIVAGEKQDPLAMYPSPIEYMQQQRCVSTNAYATDLVANPLFYSA